MRPAILLALAAAAQLSACATVTRGTTNQVTMASEPPGAEARTSLGHHCPSTPCTIEVARSSQFVATFSMPGHRDAQVPVATRVAGSGAAGFAGNILIGGIVGMGVDAATGATLEHYPNPVIGTLEPLRPVSPLIERRQRRRQAARVS